MAYCNVGQTVSISHTTDTQKDGTVESLLSFPKLEYDTSLPKQPSSTFVLNILISVLHLNVLWHRRAISLLVFINCGDFKSVIKGF